jgi:hypothetical protein
MMANTCFENKHRQNPNGGFKYEGKRKIPNMKKAYKMETTN